MKHSVFTMQGMYAYSQIICRTPGAREVIGAAMVDGAVVYEDEVAVAEVVEADAEATVRFVSLESNPEQDIQDSAFSAKGAEVSGVPGETEPLYVSALHRSPEDFKAPASDPAKNIEGSWFKNAIGTIRDKINAGIDELFGREGSVATQMMESGGIFAGVGTPAERADTYTKVGVAAAASLVLATACTGVGGDVNLELANTVLKAVFFNVMGGLGVFMLGLKLMNDGLQSVSGGTLRKVLKTLTDNRVAALAVGTGVTAIIQSSSVTSVMSLSLVDAGMMTLRQAMAVNIGANIGTTVTAWLFALKVAKYGLPIIGVGAVPYLFLNRTETIENIGKTIFGLGAVFLGLTTMSDGFKDPVVSEYLRSFFSNMSGDSYGGIAACIAAGALATGIVQSSSATLGIIIALAKSGVIPFETAAALVIGSNIGTTVTAVLAALRGGTSLEARRVAAAHVLFNVIGAAILYPVSPQYIQGLKDIMESAGARDVGTQVAMSHTVFNVISALGATAALGPYERLIRRIVPDRLAAEDKVVKHLHEGLLEQAPVIALEASRQEIIGMGRNVMSMFDDLRAVLMNDGPKPHKGKLIKKLEDDLDKVQAAIFEWLDQIATKKMKIRDAEMVGAQRRMADEYESISDALRDILKRFLKVYGHGVSLGQDAKGDLLKIHEEVASYVESANGAVEEDGGSKLAEAQKERKRLLKMVKNARKRHLLRVQEDPSEATISTYYLDILRSSNDVVERTINIADALEGGK